MRIYRGCERKLHTTTCTRVQFLIFRALYAKQNAYKTKKHNYACTLAQLDCQKRSNNRALKRNTKLHKYILLTLCEGVRRIGREAVNDAYCCKYLCITAPFSQFLVSR